MPKNKSEKNSYHKIKVSLLDGSHFYTKSTYGKENDTLQSECDFASHPAWNDTGKNIINERGVNVSKYRNRANAMSYGSIEDL